MTASVRIQNVIFTLASGISLAIRDGNTYVYMGNFAQNYDDQPILWRVLSVQGNDILLLSEYVIETMSFGKQPDQELAEWGILCGSILCGRKEIDQRKWCAGKSLYSFVG